MDWVLREKSGLKQGLADSSKVKIEKAKGKSKESPKATEKDHRQTSLTVAQSEVHRCLILDPAAGTGTFLYEVIRQIREKLGHQKGAWGQYVKVHLLPRVFGFELMMAPYAVCHMKLGLELQESGYDFSSDERLGVYLTNTLEEAEDISGLLGFGQFLSDEAKAANKVKRDLPIMVVLGNPPYSGNSSNRGKWIENLIDDYRKIGDIPLGEKKIWIKNDYVKFIYLSEHANFEDNHMAEIGHEYRAVKGFALSALFWAIVGLLVGILISLQLAQHLLKRL